MPELYTIGFTKTSAKGFFGRLRTSGARTLIDVRLNNKSQLAGFAKGQDLPYFLKEICGMEYAHETKLAPSDDMLKAFKRDKGDWSVYRDSFLGLMSQRKIESSYTPDFFQESCLLCSEDKPHHCHRSLVCEYLNGKWGGALSVKHL